MRKRRWMLIILFFLIQLGSISLVSSTNASSVADDWIMFRHDQIHSGYTNSSRPTDSVKPLWNYSTSASVWSSPAIADGLVLVGCKDSNVYGLNASSGELVWKFPTGGEVNSSPAINNGCVFVGCDDGWVYCLNISSGSPVWISKVGGLVRSSPVVSNDKVYVGSGDHDFLCLNASDGSTLWAFPTQFSIYSSPAIFDDIVYFATDDGYVYSLNAATGEEIWHRHTGSNVNSPCVSDGYLYIGSYEGWFYCLNASVGTEIWKYQTQDTIASSAAVAYGYVYVGSEDCNVYCLNVSTGKKVWQYSTGYWVWSSPAIADGNVYIGSEDYYIYCLDAFTGAEKWSYQTGSNVDSSPAIVNNILYVGSHDYHIYAFKLYNWTTEASSPKSTELLPWTTVAFDAIAFTIAVLTIFAIVYYVQSVRQTRRKTYLNIDKRNTNWLLAHENTLCALVILGFSILFFLNLGGGPLWAADEKTYSQMAYHMVKSGDYFFPWSFGEQGLWIGKPPFLMWLMSISYQAFGVNNFASRIWSPLFGILSLIMAFYLAKNLYNRHVGFLSVIVLGTFTTFFDFATHAMTDGPLVCFILASVYFLLLSEGTKKANLYAVLSGLFFGLALMTKQFEALLIPIIMIAYYIITKRSVRFLLTKRFALFCGVALLIFCPWVIYMNFRFKDFWECYFVYSAFMRTITPLEGHARDYLFYFNYLATNENRLWAALLPLAGGLCTFNAIIKRSKADILLLSWIVIVLVIFTLAQTKLYWYILPAIPAFAIIISNFLYQTLKKIKISRLRFRRSQKSRE